MRHFIDRKTKPDTIGKDNVSQCSGRKQMAHSNKTMQGVPKKGNRYRDVSGVQGDQQGEIPQD